MRPRCLAPRAVSYDSSVASCECQPAGVNKRCVMCVLSVVCSGTDVWPGVGAWRLYTSVV